jgi:uncharacterized protein (TIGR00251 family)
MVRHIFGRFKLGLLMNLLLVSISVRNANMSGVNISDGLVNIKIKPNASRNEVVGVVDGVLHVRVKAVASKGKANSELVKFLRKISGKKVKIVSGLKSRDKRIRVS